MCLIVVISAIFLGVHTWCSELSIRTAGYALQLIGMVFAIRGLLSIRIHFGQPLLRKGFLDWLSRFPKWKGKVVVEVGDMNVHISLMAARPEVWTPDRPDQPIEKRVDSIIQNLDRIRKTQREQTNLINELQKSYEKHKKAITKQVKETEDKIQTDRKSFHTSVLSTFKCRIAASMFCSCIPILGPPARRSYDIPGVT